METSGAIHRKTMKYREIPKLKYLLSITFGLYVVYWGTQIRNDLVRKYNQKIPSALWIIASAFIIFPLIIYTMFIVLPNINKQAANSITGNQQTQTQTQSTLDKECYVTYSQNKLSDHSNVKTDKDKECLEKIDTHFANKTDASEDFISNNFIFIALAVFGVLPVILSIFWIAPFINALYKVLNIDKNDTSHARLLANNPISFVISMQTIINNQISSNYRQRNQSPQNNTNYSDK